MQSYPTDSASTYHLMDIIPIIPLREETISPSTVRLADRENALDVLEPSFIARTSDRILFKRCRRLWGWTSVNGQGRKMRTEADYFWFGTGMHYALEDFHGIQQYASPALAFKAYVVATQAANRCPATWRELELLGMGIMAYYSDLYLAKGNRDPLETYVVDGVPQVEVNARIDLGIRSSDGRKLLYGFTLDRVAIDEFGQLWIVEYKSAKSFRVHHFDIDDQITAYCWCAWRLYGRPVAGVVYQQHKKSLPDMPKVLSTGKVSTDARQSTTAALYGELLSQMYGSVAKAPNQNVILYNKFVAEETEEMDRFVRRDKVERSEQQLLSFEAKLLMELEDMVNPDLPLYPNPGKDCEWGCPLQAACVAMDRGDDWLSYLDAYTFTATTVAEEQIKWRRQLPHPSMLNLSSEALQYQNLLAQLRLLEPESPPELPSESTSSPTMAFLEELGM